MIRSMTGFGTADGTVGPLRVEVEARSVNHRFFSPSLRLPAAFARWEADAREVVRAHVSRGHVTVAVRTEREVSSAATVRLDTARLAEYAAAYRDVVTSFGTPPVGGLTDGRGRPGGGPAGNPGAGPG